MSNYSIFTESARILNSVLSDPKLDLPASFAEAAKKVKFIGGDDQPFVLTPLKITESCASLTALVATAANVVAAERYGIGYQDVQVNTDLATLFLESVLLPTIGGRPFTEHPQMIKELANMDVHSMQKPVTRYATNVYKTKDGRWYHLHGSMNAGPTMKMLGVDESDLTPSEAIEMYGKKVAEWESADIERTANEQFNQAGVICQTPQEFFSSEHGSIMAQEPLWNKTSLPAPRRAWPESTGNGDYKPLAGIRVIDFSRVIAAPAVSKILAVLGADVLRVSCDKLPEYPATMPDLQTGKRDTNLDMKTEAGKKAFADLVKGADVLVDGYRPGALQRLGFDSSTLRTLNPSLIYMRENCYGFKGPLAGRSGWQQISDCLVGLSWLQGEFLGLDEPVVPLLRYLANSDYQTGLIGAAAVIDALLARTKEDVTFDLDISLTQYNIWYYRLGTYTEDQQRRLRNRDTQFNPRHFDDMSTLVGKTHQSFGRVRPDMLAHPEYYWAMTGKEYGVDEDIKILAPAFTFESTKIGWDIPTGRRGRSAPAWLPL
ncbi:hypothetical protein VSDG_02977 [Cytospora chrysosperma]|uniref:Uncharacterized protein n=1 Tax=Cytospora chrysosperma TaxID=252740 RepID=A0A423W8Z5_CYTCH|nr:hypothetical protein VSDG_02977 [Valsa sordida]